MAMDVGKKGGVVPGINVTPLVDVVLVLLIIFMVVTPMLQREMQLRLPSTPPPDAPPPPPDDRDTALIKLHRDTIEFGGSEVRMENLQAALERHLGRLSDKVVFVKVDDDVPHGRAVEIFSMARRAGAEMVAPVLKSPEEQD